MGRKVARKKKTADVLGSIFVGNTDASLGFPNSLLSLLGRHLLLRPTVSLFFFFFFDTGTKQPTSKESPK